MAGNIPYHMSDFQHQPGGDSRHPMNLAHSGQSQSRYQSSQMHSSSLSQQQQQQQYQRLKVEDALSYLDKVKLQFSTQPEVYNKFLDIMKEFKSQSIDTMGVINRVSELFNGHTELIVGFNTFLPPGYKIEMNSTSDSINVYHDGQRVPSLGTSLSMRSGLASTSQSHGTSHLSSAVSMCDVQHLASRQPHQRHLSESQRTSTSGDTSSLQPVEFDHAILYVNKIKSRYQSRPDIYKSFLEILHYYQKVQRDLKEGNAPPVPIMTESEVYDKVARLFQDQPDLLAEFGQFLPDAGGGSTLKATMSTESSRSTGAHPVASGSGTPSSAVKKLGASYTKSTSSAVSGSKMPHRRRLSNSISSSTLPVPVKKMKTELVKDVSLAEAGKYGSLNDFAFFDKIRKTLNSDRAYADFLRCVKLYTMGVLSSSDFIIFIQPFFVKAPELKKRLKELLRQRDDTTEPTPVTHSKERMTGEFAMDIDFASCKKYTESYRGLPSSYVPPRCSGRTELCNEVLNDTIVSFPSWSEDSSSVIKKTMAEEQIFRCEEDRYQLDIVLENVNSTILALEGVNDKLSRMSPEDQAKFRLDNSLGGRSEALHRKTIMRLYKDHGSVYIDALKKSPAVAVPLVLHRLREKARELREAKHTQQKMWNEQNQKYYLKSLDHQGLNFKQMDMKQLRSKALIAEIETAFDERQETLQPEKCSQSTASGPLMTFIYQRPAVLDDAMSLIIHHVKRQSSIHGDEKRKIKRLLKQFLPVLFFMPPGELSDDEEDEEPADRDVVAADVQNQSHNDCGSAGGEQQQLVNSAVSVAKNMSTVNDNYSLLFGNNNWYLLMRLHYILSDRLAYFYNHAQKAIESENERPKSDTMETALALRLKPLKSVGPDNYYSVFLEMVRNYLDGNMETTTYEEQLREMFGIHAYVGFTMDKLIQNIVRQLQHLVTDATSARLIELFYSEQRALGSEQQRTSAELSYQRKAEALLSEDSSASSCFKICVYKKDCRLTVDLLEIDSTQSDNIQEATDAWCDYVSQFVNTEMPSATESQVADGFSHQPVLLRRNVQRGMLRNKHNGQQMPSTDSSSDSTTTASDSSLSLMDDVECKFNVNSYRMCFVTNTETYLYRRNALTVARESHKLLSARRHEKFMSCVNRWVNINTVRGDIEACNDFLMGNMTGLVPCQTVTETVANENTAPFYSYTRYHVKYTTVEQS